jgi:hypothetical protein
MASYRTGPSGPAGHHEFFGRGPDWVICGMPHPGGVVVYASNDLDRGTFEMHRDILDHGYLGSPIDLGPEQYTLTVDGHSFVVVEAATYAEAMAKLMEHWTPEPAEAPPAITPSRPALPG